MTDFGLAFNEDEMTLTRDGAILGTPRYMAPEQARGESSIDARADVYALGITRYEMLTGHPALPGRELVEILRQAQEHVPPPVRKYSRSVPRDFETIVSKRSRSDEKTATLPHEVWRTT